MSVDELVPRAPRLAVHQRSVCGLGTGRRARRALKYEPVHLHELRDGPDAVRSIGLWIDFHTDVRPLGSGRACAG